MARGISKFPTRNLTPLFLRCRNDRRAGKLRTASAEMHGQSLVPAVEMLQAALPPAWADSADEAKQDLLHVREKLLSLTKAQQKRLRNVFTDDTTTDKGVEAVSNEISAKIVHCERHIHLIKTRGGQGSTKEVQIRENVQRTLATQLQELSQQFRHSQKVYMDEIRARQKGGLLPETTMSTAADGLDFGFDEQQLQEIEALETEAGRRSSEICSIASSVTELHTIFRELAVLVIDQGSILDRIDYNIEQVVVQSSEARRQLDKAREKQKSNLAMKCIYILLALNGSLFGLLILKARS